LLQLFQQATLLQNVYPVFLLGAFLKAEYKEDLFGDFANSPAACS
jgi:hypothetical protein